MKLSSCNPVRSASSRVPRPCLALNGYRTHRYKLGATRYLSSQTENVGKFNSNVSSTEAEESFKRYGPGGYHAVRLGDTFNNKYQVLSKLGFGIHSTVWLAKDTSVPTARYVALKILIADAYSGSRSSFELDILKHIGSIHSTHPGSSHVVRLSNNFVHDGQNGKHLCLVLDLMGHNVSQLQKSFPNEQLPQNVVRQIARQTLEALDWLHGSCGVIHTDIKPDNLLIEIEDIHAAVDQQLASCSGFDEEDDVVKISRPITSGTITGSSRISVKITDFGVASWRDNHLTERIQPLALRAPEVFLGAPWDTSVDIWAFACVIYELLQGRVLFRGRPGPNDVWTAEEDQLAQMIELFGPVPASLRQTGRLASKYFNEDGNLSHIKHLYPYSLRELLAQTKNPSMSSKDYGKFEAFLRAMLQYEPGARKTAKDLLEDPWLQD